jgi:uncharacterized OB-fold protein
MAATDPYLPPELSVLFPDHISAEFWERCGNHELSFQRCTECGAFRHPPGPVCWSCRSTAYEYTPVSGDGTIYSFTIVTHALSPDLAPYVPYNVALVEFADAPGVRLVSNVVDAAPDELAIGAPVRVHWDETSDGATLPRFVKA